MKVVYHTALAAARSHVTRLNHDPISGNERVPSVGEIIRFCPRGLAAKFFELEVIKIVTNVVYENANLYPQYMIEIELGLPKNLNPKLTIPEWSTWLLNHLS